MKNILLTFVCNLMLFSFAFAQPQSVALVKNNAPTTLETIYDTDEKPATIGLQGTVQRADLSTALSEAKISVLDARMKTLIETFQTDDNGNFNITLPYGADYILKVDRANYFKSERLIKSSDVPNNLTFALEPKPGYVFDVTVFDGGERVEGEINLVNDTRVEIYNNTTKKEALVVDNNPKAAFNFTFQEGNHYTILVRKNNYFNRRIEAYVDVEGCILCLEGMGVERPDVVDLLTHENQLGYLLGYIAMDTIEVGKTFTINDIYYDFDQSYIRKDAAKELDKLVRFLRDNPAIEVELSAHTDSRGSDTYNQSLSERRASSAVEYIVQKGGISDAKIESKGYGESKLVNSCSNGVTCSEKEHQQNRRTEVTITKIEQNDPLDAMSLKQIIEDPNAYKKVIELEVKQQTKATKKSVSKKSALVPIKRNSGA